MPETYLIEVEYYSERGLFLSSTRYVSKYCSTAGVRAELERFRKSGRLPDWKRIDPTVGILFRTPRRETGIVYPVPPDSIEQN